MQSFSADTCHVFALPTLLPAILDSLPSRFRHAHRSGLSARRERGPVYGERTMAVVTDFLLGSCIFAFVTGIVIAAANLLI